MVNKLSESEIQELKKLHRTFKDRKSADKIKAILLKDNGYSQKEIAEILLLDEDTISKWIRLFQNRKDTISWLVCNYVPYSGKLTPEEESIVDNYVENTIINDSKQVVEFIKNCFGIEFHRNSVVSLLHRLKFNYKKLITIPSGYDADVQKEWKETYEEFCENLKEDEVILCVDGVHPQHNTKTTCAWIKEGQHKTIPSNSGRQRININGAYNPYNQDIIFRTEKTINADSTIELFKDIENFYPNKATIYIVRDNARYYSNAKVLKYLENSRIEIIPLPTYSPNLNLIERLWKILRKDVINNVFYDKFKLFKEAIVAFLSNNSPSHRAKLKQSIGLKLHLLPT